MRYLLLALALIACKEEPRTVKKRAPRPAAVDEEESKAPAAAPSDDPSWISGTWQKRGGREWLLFNPPSQVAVLAGKPVTMKSRGKYILHGRYLTLQLPQPNGVMSERYLDVAPDHSRLSEEGTGISYERGSPPP